jgi:hypothetical protein
MEAIAADAVLVIQLPWQAVQVGFWWHGLVEGRIKDRYLGYAWQEPFRFIDAHQIGWIVQGSQFYVILYRLEDFSVDLYRRREFLTTMNNPVPYGIDILYCRQYAIYRMHQCLSDMLHGRRMVMEIFLDLYITLGRTLAQDTTSFTDTLYGTTTDALLVRHAEYLVFQGRAAAVQYEYASTIVRHVCHNDPSSSFY